MAKFCENCGKEVQEGQEVCLGCGKVLIKNNENSENNNKTTVEKNHGAYYKISSIIMIVIAVCLFSANGQYTDTNMQFGFPALFALIGAIICLAGQKNKTMILVSGICYAIGGVINCIGISDISIFAIIGFVFAGINIYHSTKME